MTFKLIKYNNVVNNAGSFIKDPLPEIPILKKDNMKRNDNNGWLHIDGYDDIPLEITECFVYDDDGDIGYYTFGLVDLSKDYSHVMQNNITHYQPIVKPLPPTE